MDRIEAELQAIRDKWEDECRKRKDAVLDDPTELFQALQPVGMTVAGDENRIYELLGEMTRQGMDIQPNQPVGLMRASQIIDNVIEISNLIESAVEDYIEEDHGE